MLKRDSFFFLPRTLPAFVQAGSPYQPVRKAAAENAPVRQWREEANRDGVEQNPAQENHVKRVSCKAGLRRRTSPRGKKLLLSSRGRKAVNEAVRASTHDGWSVSAASEEVLAQYGCIWKLQRRRQKRIIPWHVLTLLISFTSAQFSARSGRVVRPTKQHLARGCEQHAA